MAVRREVAQAFVNRGELKMVVCEIVSIARSSFYRNQPERTDDRFFSTGRPVPGYTVNRNGTLVMDSTIVNCLQTYRSQVEYSNACGVRKLTYLLRREHSFYINHKKIYRLCRENALLLERRSEKPYGNRARYLALNRKVTSVNQVWQCDIKYGYVQGEDRFFFVLAFIDVFSRKVVGEHVGLRCQAGDLTSTLKQAIKAEGITEGHGLVIRSDNGPQMTANETAQWLEKQEQKLTHEFIPIRTPNKNAFIESFFSILELEFMAVSYFASFSEAYERTHKFIRFYNEKRIHGPIGYITPTEAMDKIKRGEILNIKTISM